MTYEEIVSKVKKHYQSYKPAGKDDWAAIQFDVTGEGEGAFYIKIADGKIEVEPYEYLDHDIKVTSTADVLMKIVDGETDIVNANLSGELSAEGDLQKAEVFSNLVKKTKAAAPKKAAPEKAAPEKKAAPKKTATAQKTASSKKTSGTKKTSSTGKTAAKKAGK